MIDFLRALFRRLLGAEGAPRCFLCSARVRARDLRSGRAVVLGRRPYCPACVRSYTAGSAGAGGALLESSSHASGA